MIDLVQLQEDITQVLLCAGSLARVNVFQYRKMRMQSEIDRSAVYLTSRSESVKQAGVGVLVEMPEFTVPHPNLPGPETVLNIACLVIEEPNLNMAADTGTGLSAETVAQWVLDTLHHWMFDGYGQLYADANAIQPDNSLEGVLIAYRVTLKMEVPRAQTARCDVPTISESAPITVSDGGFGGTNGTFPIIGTVAGRNAYGDGNDTLDPDNPGLYNGAIVFWDAAGISGTVGWVIEFNGTAHYVSAEDVATPNLVSAWASTGAPGDFPPPTVTASAPLFTLTNSSSNANASIYFTTDGSFPGPSNSAATAYTNPFAANVGTVIRWAAYQTGYLPSIVNKATVT